MTLCLDPPSLATVDVSLRSEGSGHLFPTLSPPSGSDPSPFALLLSLLGLSWPQDPGASASLRQVFPLLCPQADPAQ